MKNLKSIIFFLILFILISTYKAFSCFTIVVGKKASKTGNLLFAHNEDDSSPPYIFFRKQIGTKESETFNFKSNTAEGKISGKILSHFWIEFKNENFADFLYNENTVAVASNACPSIIKKSGRKGLRYFLRLLTVQRAKSAKDAVRLAGELIEKYGYASSGRTYTFVDSNEAWALSVAQGKIWLAKRVPDDEVFFIPNYYKIQDFDPSNKKDFIYSKHLIKALKKMGIKVKKGVKINFAEIFKNKDKNNIYNSPRDKRAYEILCGEKFKGKESVPFSCKPKNKISIETLKKVLRDHYDLNPEYMKTEEKNFNPNSDWKLRPICVKKTKYSFILEQSEFPILWLSPTRPDVSPYIPVPLLLDKLPYEFYIKSIKPYDYEKIYKNHFNYYYTENLDALKNSIFFKAYLYLKNVDKNYLKNIKIVKKDINKIEKEFKEKAKLQRKLYEKNRDKRVLEIFLRATLNRLKEFYTIEEGKLK